MTISFFYKKAFFHRDDTHLMRGSSLIRGEQIADFLGAKKNPADGFGSDLCILVNPHVNKYKELPQNSYVDLIDTKYFVDKLSQRPDLKIIVTSLPALSSIKMVLPQHKIYLIPQHHCNFERVRRTRKELTTIGFIGSPRNFQLDSEDFSKRCSGLGLKFMYKIDYKNRGHVCNFLQQIDVQLDWRPKSEANNPLKIINAASFGVPTIAFPKDGYQEIDGYYFKAENSDEIFEIISNLKRNGDEYTRHTQVGMIMAEEYHIQKIAKFYLALN